MQLQLKVQSIPIEDIEVTGHNFREVFEVEDLVESIQRDGLLQPPSVTEDFKLISGERRLRAAREIGLSEIPCNIVRIKSPEHMRALGVVENIKRKNFTPSEEAKAIAWYRHYYQSTGQVTTKQDVGRGKKKTPGEQNFAEKLSTETGVAQSTINRKARMGEKMSETVSIALDLGEITEKQVEQLCKVDKRVQDEILCDVKGKDVPQTKAIVEAKLKNAPPQMKIDGVPVDIFATRLYKDIERLEDKIQIALEKTIWDEGDGIARKFLAQFRAHLDFCTYMEREFEKVPLPTGTGGSF